MDVFSQARRGIEKEVCNWEQNPLPLPAGQSQDTCQGLTGIESSFLTVSFMPWFLFRPLMKNKQLG